MTGRTICSSVLNGFADLAHLARELGLEPDRLAAAAGVPVEALSQPGLRVPALALGRMMTAAISSTAAEDLGLRLASKRNLAAWGAVALVMREQPTLRDVLNAIHKYFHVTNETLTFAYVEVEDAVEIHVNVLQDPEPDITWVGLDTVVGQLHLNLQEMLKGGWAPSCVCFRHARPRSTEPYRRFFGVDVLFGQSFDGLVVPRRDLDRPIAGANPLLAKHVESYADQASANAAKAVLGRDRGDRDPAAPTGGLQPGAGGPRRWDRRPRHAEAACGRRRDVRATARRGPSSSGRSLSR
jgi:hypothetical protein